MADADDLDQMDHFLFLTNRKRVSDLFIDEIKSNTE